MIGKLFAQEFRSTRKSLFATTGIVLLVVVLGTGLGASRVPLLNKFGYMLALMAAVSLTVIVLALLVESYWRTMYGREGYFTMALPAKGRTLFTAKVLYGLVATYVAAALSALMLLGISVVDSLTQGEPALALVRNLFDAVDSGIAWAIIVLLIGQLMFTVITGAAVMSIGAEGRYNHLGFGAPVIGYVVLYFAMQLLLLAAMLFVPLGIVLMGPDAGSLVAQGMFSDFLAVLRDPVGSSDPNVLGLGIVPLSLVVAALFAWWGGRSVERRTSLR